VVVIVAVVVAGMMTVALVVAIVGAMRVPAALVVMGRRRSGGRGVWLCGPSGRSADDTKAQARRGQE
jgi:hypothetical protein